MPCFAALDVSQETTAICVVDDAGTIIAEKTVVTCPEMITSFLADAVRCATRREAWARLCRHAFHSNKFR
ncbi:hypothetical protein SAMN05444414_1653 [Roseovarius marisflavi]|mgnify:CR=1 FL=1|uniref:Transposase n=1 Tax=Roseovarius marisflavi TaxID=1054996 RepID=A0A1M7E1F9_9RHOB|nr:hypothetical protein SAMN05444414_1653 [Roseovarius marisflavi]